MSWTAMSAWFHSSLSEWNRLSQLVVNNSAVKEAGSGRILSDQYGVRLQNLVIENVFAKQLEPHFFLKRGGAKLFEQCCRLHHSAVPLSPAVIQFYEFSPWLSVELTTVLADVLVPLSLSQVPMWNTSQTILYLFQKSQLSITPSTVRSLVFLHELSLCFPYSLAFFPLQTQQQWSENQSDKI